MLKRPTNLGHREWTRRETDWDGMVEWYPPTDPPGNSWYLKYDRELGNLLVAEGKWRHRVELGSMN